MNVTIREVARATGLSVATISRVLNGKGPVREETRKKVLEAAARLRWVPNVAARSLNTNETKTIGVLLPDIYGEFFSEVIRGLDLAARRRGFHVLVSGSHSDNEETEAVLRAMRGRVDGVIVMSPTIPAAGLRNNLPEGLPAVLLNCDAGAGFDSIEIDNYGGAFGMVEHLAALGHRQVAFIGGPAGNHDASERRRGWRDALRAAGVSRIADLEFPGDFSDESGYRATKAILGQRARPTAIFAANDAMAIGGLSALHEAGVPVPGGIAVAGFDDIPFARYTSPPLTSVHVSIGDLGARAVERLLDAVENGETHQHRHETLATSLVIRQSCGAPLPSDGGTSPGAARNPKRGPSSASQKPKTRTHGSKDPSQKKEER